MEIIFPLIGVIIGWLLNEVSSLMRLKYDDVKAYRSTLTDLFRMRSYLNNILLNIHRAAEYANKLNFDIAEMEKRRRRNNELIIENIDDIEKSFKSSLNKISCIDPLIAYDISSFIDGLTKLNALKLDNVVKDNLLYINAILQIEITLEIMMMKFDKTIVKLSKKVGVVHYFKIKKYLKKICIAKEFSFLDYLDANTRNEYMEYYEKSDLKYDKDFAFDRIIDRLQKINSK